MGGDAFYTRPMMRRWFAFWTVAVVLLAAACGEGGGSAEPTPLVTDCAPPVPEENVLENPGFESGSAEPWAPKESWGTEIEVTDAQAQTGQYSVLLQMRSDDPPEGELARVYGVFQDVRPEELPEIVSGCYFVERWEQGTPNQYLQVVAIVQRARNIPQEVLDQGVDNHQLRYILAGSAEQPTRISNARYVMVSREAPETGRWVPFRLHLRDDFERLWGDVPEHFDVLSLFFEVRWDNRAPEDGPSVADVYYDDLYAGPAEPSQ